jgi:hypothetical protein
LGHSDLASTMVYLMAVRSKDVLHKINSILLADNPTARLLKLELTAALEWFEALLY